MIHAPFPGIGPYLEAPNIWPEAHTSRMSIFRERLAPLLASKYLAELETQVVIDRESPSPYLPRTRRRPLIWGKPSASPMSGRVMTCGSIIASHQPHRCHLSMRHGRQRC
jgi:hypothetical protein